MAHAIPVLEIVPSSSIECDDGRTPELAAAYKDPFDNANGPNGVVIADGDGLIEANVVAVSDTAAAVNAAVPASGAELFKSDILQKVIGDGAFYGGVPLNANSQHCISISADGSPAKNGQALADAVVLAGTRTPNGNALSATNMIYILLGPGYYDITALAANVTLPNFCGLIGLCGSGATVIHTISSRRIVHTTQTLGVNIYSVLRGITFTSGTPSLSVSFVLGADGTNFISIDHEDLNFPGLTNSQPCMSIGPMNGADTPTFKGSAKNVRTTGQARYGGFTSTPATGRLTLDVRFEDCEAGDFSFGASGSSIGTRDGILSGPSAALIRCKNTGTGASAFSCIVNCPMIDCDWQPAIQRVGSSAEFIRTRVREDVSGESIENNSGVTCKIANCLLHGAIGGNITNSLSGTLDGAGNLEDADV